MVSQAILHCNYYISMSICVAVIMLYCSTEAEKQLREEISILSRIIHMSTIKSIKNDLLKSSAQATLPLYFSITIECIKTKLKNQK